MHPAGGPAGAVESCLTHDLGVALFAAIELRYPDFVTRKPLGVIPMSLEM